MRSRTRTTTITVEVPRRAWRVIRTCARQLECSEGEALDCLVRWSLRGLETVDDPDLPELWAVWEHPNAMKEEP